MDNTIRMVISQKHWVEVAQRKMKVRKGEVAGHAHAEHAVYCTYIRIYSTHTSSQIVKERATSSLPELNLCR